MLIASVNCTRAYNTLTKITVEIETGYWEPRIVRPTEWERNACPDTFRCFVCEQHKKNKPHLDSGRIHDSDLGGYLNSRWVCADCYPWVDEWAVGCMIHFDEWHPTGGGSKLLWHGSDPDRDKANTEKERARDEFMVPAMDRYMSLFKTGESIPEAQRARISERLEQMRRFQGKV